MNIHISANFMSEATMTPFIWILVISKFYYTSLWILVISKFYFVYIWISVMSRFYLVFIWILVTSRFYPSPNFTVKSNAIKPVSIPNYIILFVDFVLKR